MVNAFSFSCVRAHPPYPPGVRTHRTPGVRARTAARAHEIRYFPAGRAGKSRGNRHGPKQTCLRLSGLGHGCVGT